MHQIDGSRRETHAGDYLMSRRRLLKLGLAWAAVMASFVAAGCGGEEDEGGEEEED